MRSAISPNDPRVAVLVAALDADDVPVAETWRQVAAAAERVGMRRPSYGHVRRLVRIHRRARELQRQGREVWGELAATFAAGRIPSAGWTLERLRAAKGEEELVLQEHKAFGHGAVPSAGEEGGGATGPGRRSRGP